MDPNGFCLAAKYFRSDDTFTPDVSRISNRPMDPDEVQSFCAVVMTKLLQNCPLGDVSWPTAAPSPRRKDAEFMEAKFLHC